MSRLIKIVMQSISGARKNLLTYRYKNKFCCYDPRPRLRQFYQPTMAVLTPLLALDSQAVNDASERRKTVFLLKFKLIHVKRQKLIDR